MEMTTLPEVRKDSQFSSISLVPTPVSLNLGPRVPSHTPSLAPKIARATSVPPQIETHHSQFRFSHHTGSIPCLCKRVAIKGYVYIEYDEQLSL